MENKNSAILTPIYNETIYKYHLCSNCNNKIYFEENIFRPLYFKELIKFCPYCGEEIIRYAEPKYIVRPDFKWLEKYEEIIKNAYNRLEYEIYCKNDKQQIDELIEKAKFGMEYFGKSELFYGKGNVCEVIESISKSNVHYSYKDKLRRKYEGNKEIN